MKHTAFLLVLACLLPVAGAFAQDVRDYTNEFPFLNCDFSHGIAYDGEKGVFLLTGKYWPRMFEVVFRRP